MASAYHQVLAFAYLLDQASAYLLDQAFAYLLGQAFSCHLDQDVSFPQVLAFSFHQVHPQAFSFLQVQLLASSYHQVPAFSYSRVLAFLNFLFRAFSCPQVQVPFSHLTLALAAAFHLLQGLSFLQVPSFSWHQVPAFFCHQVLASSYPLVLAQAFSYPQAQASSYPQVLASSCLQGRASSCLQGRAYACLQVQAFSSLGWHPLVHTHNQGVPVACQGGEMACQGAAGTHLLESSVAYFVAHFAEEADQTVLRVDGLAIGERVECRGLADPETGGSSGPWGFRPESFVGQSEGTYWLQLPPCSRLSQALPFVQAGLSLRQQAVQELEGFQRLV